MGEIAPFTLPCGWLGLIRLKIRSTYASLCDFRAKRLNKVGMPYQPFDPKNETFGRA
jgi:hypothetical protein